MTGRATIRPEPAESFSAFHETGTVTNDCDTTCRSLVRRKDMPLGLPANFDLRSDGIWYAVGSGDEREWRWLCTPLRVLALTRASDGNGWGHLVELTDADGRVKQWAIPARMFAGDSAEVRAGLLDRGLGLAPTHEAKAKLSALLTAWNPDRRVTTTERLGWTDASCTTFCLGNGQVLGSEHVVYQSEGAPGAAAEMRAEGTREQWREEVGVRCIGNPLMVVAVSLACAGPLLEPLNMDSGGVHLRGASSCGKSTVQRVAVSVWGAPGFLFTWRATSNGLEGVASACNATLLALDELGEVDGREAGAVTYMIGNNRGKQRADKTGRARQAATWRVGILSSGEIGLGDKLAEANKRVQAGQQVRLLDIQADGFAHGAFAHLHGEADGAAFSTALRRASAENFGQAGPAFVAALIDDQENVLGWVRDLMREFNTKAEERFGMHQLDGQTSRAIARFALIAAAGEVATRFELTGWPEGEAHSAALHLLGLWLDGRGGGGAFEARQAVERTQAFLERHGSARFEPIGNYALTAPVARPVANRAGWFDGDTYYVTNDGWHEIHAGADLKRAAQHVADAGYLEPDSDGHFSRKAPRAVSRRPRVYHVPASILGDGDDDD